MKIIDRVSLGTQPVYDIGVARAHNFALENGAIASNCFNKSHSTAYAYVTYQTAFLKANYPAEYMSALLTANSGDQDKVTRYLNNCEQTLNIKVEPPDINRSSVHFKPIANAEKPDRLNILFGLSAIKNVGEGAIEAILAARDEGGQFTSLGDLCQRVSLQSVNKRTLECLIQCGAFDRMQDNRRQLLNDLEVVIPWAQKKAKEKAMGQGNLFDLFGDTKTDDENAFEAEPRTPNVPDFPSQERLQFEQELLGVYVSDHPLKTAQKYARYQNIECVKILEIDKFKRKTVNIVALITELKPVTTKQSNKSMAIIKISDITGAKLEAVAFPEGYEKTKDALAVNVPLIVTGKISKKRDNDELQLIIESVQPIDPDFNPDEMLLPLDAEYAIEIILPLLAATDETKLQQLRAILGEYSSGDADSTTTPVYASIVDADRQQSIRLGREFWVRDRDLALDRLCQNFEASLKAKRLS
jgi:DNA polymerase III subunit alpha